MKLSTTTLALVSFLCVYLSSGLVLAQEPIKRKVDFDIDQDGMSIKGSLSVALQFTFFGYPYLKAQYSDLVIDELIYDNEVYNANTNRDIISMPFRPEKGGYPVKMSINVVIPVEANNNKGFEIRHMLPAQFFTITDNIYTISDTYSNDKIDQYFKDFNSPKYHDSHFWENSTLGNITPITVQSMTSSIPRQMTMIIDAKLREKKEKEEKEKETDKEKEEDDFDDFLNGGTKVKDDKKNTDDNFDDFLSGKKNVNDQKTSQAKSKDDFDEFLRNGKVTVVELDGNGDSYVTDKGVFYLSGLIKSTEKEFEAIIVGEDFNQEFEISNNSFNIPIILKSGANKFTIKVNNFRKKININSTRRPVKLRATLLWNTSGSDIDLHMVDNEGNECYYSNKRSGLMNLDVDNTSGFGPENIYVNQINSGTYTVYVNNYSGGIGTEATIYIYVDEVLTQTEKVKFINGKNKILIANLKF